MKIHKWVNNNYKILHKIFWCVLFTIPLGVIVTACAEEVVENMVEEQSFTEEINPTFLNLEYIYSTEEADLNRHRFGPFSVDGEITFFETHGSRGNRTFEEVSSFIQRDYGVELPESINLDSTSFVAISAGRRLRKLYYFEESRYDTFNGEVFARPVFEMDYYPSTIFIYRVTPLPRYSFICHWTFTDDWEQFNFLNNIPFEVWEYDGSMQTGGPELEERPFQRENDTWQRPWQEIEESLHGYISVQESYLRSMATRNSRIERRLAQGADFIIYGYVEDGEDIDGNSRWYYVRTSMDSGNQLGYIHSSFVTVISSVDD